MKFTLFFCLSLILSICVNAKDARDDLVGPSRPKSVVKPSPDFEGGKPFEKASTITTFSQLRQKAGEPGLLGMMPSVGDFEIDPAKYGSAFDHSDCVVKPGYFGVMLKDSGVQVELTAGHSVVAYRYTFPESKECHVLMDISRVLENFEGGEIHQRDDKTYEGVAHYSIKGRKTPIYFSFQYSKPFRQRGAWKDGKLLEGRNRIEADKGVSLGAYTYFWTHEDETILMKVGISTQSIEDARAKLAEEFPGWDFEQFCRESERAW